MITIFEVRARVEALRSADLRDLQHCLISPEAAHTEEDRLFVEVLQTIAAGAAPDPAQLANEVLKTQEIDFPRWRA